MIYIMTIFQIIGYFTDINKVAKGIINKIQIDRFTDYNRKLTTQEKDLIRKYMMSTDFNILVCYALVI